MKILRLYSNKPFHNVKFNDGFNVIYGNVTKPKDKDKDTHNLGKTTLIDVIDFLLLKKKSKSNAIFENIETFNDWVFYGEFQLNTGKFLIIKRAVAKQSKICFKLNEKKLEDFDLLIDWDVVDHPFQKSVKKLNDFLSFDVLNNWNYRKIVTYFIRSQDDFNDVFQIRKYLSGKDIGWKPLIFDLLGYDGNDIKQKYTTDETISQLVTKKENIEEEFKIDPKEKDKIVGIIEIKTREKEKREKEIDKFNFFQEDLNLSEKITKIDNQLYQLNSLRYSTQAELNKIVKSLENSSQIVDFNKIKKIYNDIEIFFPDNLEKSFNDLNDFIKKITTERLKYLNQIKSNKETKIENYNNEIYELEQNKEKLLSILINHDTYSKFKEYQKDITILQSELIMQEEKLKQIIQVEKIDTEIKEEEIKRDNVIERIKTQLEQVKHSNIRKNFDDFIYDIFKTHALISINKNKNDNLDFSASYMDEKNVEKTSEGMGHTYKKMLCMAFDLAILMEFSKKSFFRFAYHDGPFEGLDDRKKILYLNKVRDICEKYGIQYIITAINSDLPRYNQNEVIEFDKEEIVMNLSDIGSEGRLFKIDF